MPYIKKELRKELEYPLDVITGHINDMICSKPEDRAGILNYVITVLIDNAYGPLSNAKYKDYNEAIGMLECCKLEFYRKAAAPYEDMKEKQNGKVLDGGIKDLIGRSSIQAGSFSDVFKHMRTLMFQTDEDNTPLNVWTVQIKPGINVFIKATTNRLADYILVNEVLSSKEYSDVDQYQMCANLRIYKKFEDLEPGIKNAFIAKERDGLNDNFSVFLKTPWNN